MQTGYYLDVVAEAAALMESLAIDHPFVDGNKRVAFAAADVFLRVNGCRLRRKPGPGKGRTPRCPQRVARTARRASRNAQSRPIVSSTQRRTAASSPMSPSKTAAGTCG